MVPLDRPGPACTDNDRGWWQLSDKDIFVTRTDAAVAIVALNRPHRRNACTLAMWWDLAGIFDDLAGDEGVRSVILTGSGGYFCAGADISEFDKVRNGAAQGAVYERAVEQCSDAISDLPKPTIAAITGYCIGGGFGLAQVCDFRVADRTAEFGIPAARLGIVYGRKECQSLMSLVGLARAKEILFTAEIFGAERAVEIGFVDRLVEGEALDGAKAFAADMNGSAPLTISGCKLILNALAKDDVEMQQDRIDAAAVVAMESEDYREGVRAFAEKRQAVFKGR